VAGAREALQSGIYRAMLAHHAGIMACDKTRHLQHKKRQTQLGLPFLHLTIY